MKCGPRQLGSLGFYWDSMCFEKLQDSLEIRKLLCLTYTLDGCLGILEVTMHDDYDTQRMDYHAQKSGLPSPFFHL